jgi:hypothetical protein
MMRATAIAIILFCALPFAQAGTLITNDTFETGDTSGWTAASTPFFNTAGSCNTGFAAQSNGGGCATGAAPAFGTYAAYSSTSFPAISSDVGEWLNSLSQNFVAPSGPISSATLSFEYEAAWGGTGTFRGVNVEAVIFLGSSPVDQVPLVINPQNSGSIGWILSSTDVTALLTTYAGQTLTLELFETAFFDTRDTVSFTSATTLNAGFDNVQITTVTSSTPEPGTVWMAAGGLSLLLASRVAMRRI